MPVKIDAHGNAILLDVPLEAVHRRQRSLIRIKLGIHPASGVINVAHQDTMWASSFKPIMMRAVYLHHITTMLLPSAPQPVLPLGVAFFPDSSILKPYSQ